jgi:hypothetical protein
MKYVCYVLALLISVVPVRDFSFTGNPSFATAMSTYLEKFFHGQTFLPQLWPNDSFGSGEISCIRSE